MAATPLKDNPPLPGKRFFIVSMISPESRQKHDVYGIKIHDMCDTEEEGRKLIEYYHDLDPAFDVFLGTVGRWCPWVFDPSVIKDAVYADQKLTEIMAAHREEHEKAQDSWNKRVQAKNEEMEKLKSKEYVEAKVNDRDRPVSIAYKIKQLEHIVTERQHELERYKGIFEDQYTEEEREEALKSDIPDVPVVEPLFKN